MHAYRDALSPACRGAYAMYPGDELLMYPTVNCDVHTHRANVDNTETSKMIQVALDGVGAIPARSGASVKYLPAVVRTLLNLYNLREES